MPGVCACAYLTSVNQAKGSKFVRSQHFHISRFTGLTTGLRTADNHNREDIFVAGYSEVWPDLGASLAKIRIYRSRGHIITIV